MTRVLPALVLAAVVGCGSREQVGDAEEPDQATDVDGDALDSLADFLADPPGDEIDEGPGRCLFHPQPIDLWIEGFDCEGLAEGEHRQQVVYGRIQSFVLEPGTSHFIVEVTPVDFVQVNFSRLQPADIVHNLEPGDEEIYISAVVYRHGACIRGMEIWKTCAFNNNLVIVFRLGDAASPLYPVSLVDSMFQIEESPCELSGDPWSDCDVDTVYRLEYQAHTGEILVLEQGQTGTIVEDNGVVIRVMNRYSYHSPDCGGDMINYFMQMWDPPWLCEF